MQKILRTLSIVAVGLFLTACMKSKPETASTREALIRSNVPPMVLVILADQPELKSNILTLQDYHRDGRSFIPIFHSKESFHDSTQGGISKPIYEIDRRLFVSILHGSETVILDPGLLSEIIMTGDDLKRNFPEPFDPSHQGAVQ